MSNQRQTTVSGRITHIFAHRFVIRSPAGEILADLTPKGLEQVTLHINDEVTLIGEMKPSELKVSQFTRENETVAIPQKQKKEDDPHPYTDPAIVLASTRAAGYQIVGALRRKPRHFEILGQRKDGFHELHVALDGHIRKSKPVAKDDPKWAAEINSAA